MCVCVCLLNLYEIIFFECVTLKNCKYSFQTARRNAWVKNVSAVTPANVGPAVSVPPARKPANAQVLIEYNSCLSYCVHSSV